MNVLIMGSRGSKLALRQSEILQEALATCYPELETRLEIIKTRGDTVQDRPISKVGDKSIFTKELEEALLRGQIDIAVHSAKDLTAERPPGIVIGAVLPRGERADAFCSVRHASLEELPRGARVGSGSLRRAAQIKCRRPDLEIAPIRGNVDTRIRKLQEGQYDSVILSAAGLDRLQLGAHIKQKFDPHDFLPAPAQGAIVVEMRSDREEVRDLVRKIGDEKSLREIKAERALVERVEGGCLIPLGGSAWIRDKRLEIKAGLFSPDGSRSLIRSIEGSAEDPVGLGWTLAKTLLRDGGRAILDELSANTRGVGM